MSTSIQRFVVYCHDRDINDATFRYIEIMRRGLSAAGLVDAGVTSDLATIRAADYVVTISCLFAARAMLAHPKGKLIHWFQGIEAVERRFIHGGVKGLLQYPLWAMVEKLIVRRAHLKLYVSQQMRQFLHDRPRADGLGQAVVMPCYNATFDAAAFGRKDRYARLDLAYAGSMHAWQCVTDVLRTYMCLRKQSPQARLTLFTRETAAAKAMCSAIGAADVRIQTVAPSELLHALRDFSYGFILRDEMDINRVSTPTKLSTYLAAGVIPIITTATPALLEMLADSPYKVVAKTPSAHEAIAQAIHELSAIVTDSGTVRDSFARIFAQHMDDELNAERLMLAIGRTK